MCAGCARPHFSRVAGQNRIDRPFKKALAELLPTARPNESTSVAVDTFSWLIDKFRARARAPLSRFLSFSAGDFCGGEVDCWRVRGREKEKTDKLRMMTAFRRARFVLLGLALANIRRKERKTVTAPDVDIWEVTSRLACQRRAKQPEQKPKRKTFSCHVKLPEHRPAGPPAPLSLASIRKLFGRPMLCSREPSPICCSGLRRNAAAAAARYMFPSRLKYAYCEMILGFFSVKSGVARRRS